MPLLPNLFSLCLVRQFRYEASRAGCRKARRDGRSIEPRTPTFTRTITVVQRPEVHSRTAPRRAWTQLVSSSVADSCSRVRSSESGYCDSEAIQIKEAIKLLLEDIGLVVCQGSHLIPQVAGLETIGPGPGLVFDHFSQMRGLQFYGTAKGAYHEARVANADCLVPDHRP